VETIANLTNNPSFTEKTESGRGKSPLSRTKLNLGLTTGGGGEKFAKTPHSS
jgi:hypothetical protein